MTDTLSIDGISNVRVVRQRSDILNVDYSELHFDVQVSADTDDRVDLVCQIGDQEAEKAEREDIPIENGTAVQHVMATYHEDAPSGLFLEWQPGEPIELELFVVEANHRESVATRDITEEIATALADGEERSLQEQLDALRKELESVQRAVAELERFHDGLSR